MSAEARLYNLLTAEMATWLDAADFEPIVARVRGWDEATWQAARQVAMMQGVGPYLAHYLPQTPLYPVLPAWFQMWLQTNLALNTERIARIHADLGVLLHAANREEIPVLLLKGSLLTTCFYSQPGIRPMADLDLLIHPADRQRFGQVLVENGYRLVHPDSRWSQHDYYANLACERAVVADEHPDNPRPVEVHIQLAQKFWGAYSLPDMTHALWQTGQARAVLDATAFVPAPEQHLAFIALHHLKHLMFQSGRLIQWLDVAYLMSAIPAGSALPHLDLIYPILRFAARAFPSRFPTVDWETLARQVHPRVQRWCEETPLDQRCGLQMLTEKDALSRWRSRWLRWHPSPLRLSLAYGNIPLPLAYLRYVAQMLTQVGGV